MSDDELWAAIADERRALADLLAGLTPEQWETPSLCGAWTVKEVAVHLLPTVGKGLAEFGVAMVRARGNFHRANLAVASRHAAALGAEDVVAALRDGAGSRFTPPGVGVIGPYTDVLAHGEDIRVPLGLDDDRPAERWRPALDFLFTRTARTGFLPAAPPDLWYQATDIEWQHGAADVVSGPAAALALALTGRTARLDELDGPGQNVLAEHARR